MQVLYTAVATARADDGHAELRGHGADLAMPLSLPICKREAPDANQPEQLFAAGFAACFGGSVALVAAQRRIQTGPVSIRAQVNLNRLPQGGHGLSVRLEGDLPNLSLREALALMQAAEAICPYANALRGNIPVLLTVAPRPHEDAHHQS